MAYKNPEFEFDYSFLNPDLPEHKLVEARKKIQKRIGTTTFPGTLKGTTGVIGVMLISGLASLFLDSDLEALHTWNTVYLSLLAAIVAIPILAPLWYWMMLGREHKFSRIELFAQQNNIKYRIEDRPKSSQGIVFGAKGAKGRLVADVLALPNGVELGNYHFERGGDQSAYYKYGYVAIPLTRNLPHMVLDAKSNNLTANGTNLPINLTQTQALSLEGNFDKYFTAYAPKDYSSDLLYVFTPDVMEFVINKAKDYDFEIINKTLYLFRKKKFNLLDAKDLQQTFGLVDGLVAELKDKVARYSGLRTSELGAEPTFRKGSMLKGRRPTSLKEASVWLSNSAWVLITIVATFVIIAIIES